VGGEGWLLVVRPWALCTANFAQLYYGLSNTMTQTQTVPFDNLSADLTWSYAAFLAAVRAKTGQSVLG
jgi:hypothetical protein